jgi:hypothetical protein
MAAPCRSPLLRRSVYRRRPGTHPDLRGHAPHPPHALTTGRRTTPHIGSDWELSDGAARPGGHRKHGARATGDRAAGAGLAARPGCASCPPDARSHPGTRRADTQCPRTSVSATAGAGVSWAGSRHSGRRWHSVSRPPGGGHPAQQWAIRRVQRCLHPRRLPGQPGQRGHDRLPVSQQPVRHHRRVGRPGAGPTATAPSLNHPHERAILLNV